MTDQKIVIAALARDCNDALLRNIPRLEELCSNFREWHIVVVENDSKDNTKATLREWAQKSEGQVTVISQDFGSTTIGGATYNDPYPYFGRGRIAKMAKYRNIYMDYIRHNIKDLDLLMMIDIDIEYFSISGILESLNSAPQNWGALFGFGKTSIYFPTQNATIFDLYWDTFAYVKDDVSKPCTLQHVNKMHRRVAKAINEETYHQCASAFGGIGIYKWQLIKDLSYTVEDNDDENIKARCEHIPFHAQIENPLYVCKPMVIDYGKTSLFRHILRKITPSQLRVLYNKLKH